MSVPTHAAETWSGVLAGNQPGDPALLGVGELGVPGPPAAPARRQRDASAAQCARTQIPTALADIPVAPTICHVRFLDQLNGNRHAGGGEKQKYEDHSGYHDVRRFSPSKVAAGRTSLADLLRGELRTLRRLEYVG